MEGHLELTTRPVLTNFIQVHVGDVDDAGEVNVAVALATDGEVLDEAVAVVVDAVGQIVERRDCVVAGPAQLDVGRVRRRRARLNNRDVNAIKDVTKSSPLRV